MTFSGKSAKMKKILTKEADIMKKIIAMLLIFSIFILSLTSCKSNQSSYSYDDYEEQETEETTEEETTYIPETTIASTPVSEWGFYNLDEMGNQWIQITGYSLSGSQPYVTYVSDYQGNNMLFQNGYCRRIIIEKNNDGLYSSSDGKVICSYKIVDNNTIYCPENGKSLVIENRKTFDTAKHFVIIEAQDEMYVPASLLDLERGIIEYDANERRNLSLSSKEFNIKSVDFGELTGGYSFDKKLSEEYDEYCDGNDEYYTNSNYRDDYYSNNEPPEYSFKIYLK